jgi:hypothetical protein
VVAPTGVKTAGWLAAAALAAGLIGVLAFHGERPEPGLARFAPEGVLADWPVQLVSLVDLSAGGSQRSFRRDPSGGWHPEAGVGLTAADLSQKIETALTLLHNSGPQRTDLVSEHLSEFGLEAPRLTVTAHMTGGASITIEFGGTNPLGLGRYARLAGRSEIWLMPAFVADAWDSVTAAQ